MDIDEIVREGEQVTRRKFVAVARWSCTTGVGLRDGQGRQAKARDQQRR